MQDNVIVSVILEYDFTWGVNLLPRSLEVSRRFLEYLSHTTNFYFYGIVFG